MYYYPVPKAKANSGGDLSIRDTRSSPTLAKATPIEKDLAFIHRLGPKRPLPWMQKPGEVYDEPPRLRVPPHA